MSALFDINSVTDFLRSLLRLLDEWETFAEGGGKVVSLASALLSKLIEAIQKNLFRGQRGGRKPTGGPISDMSAGFNDGESLIVNFNLVRETFLLGEIKMLITLLAIFSRLLSSTLFDLLHHTRPIQEDPWNGPTCSTGTNHAKSRVYGV